MNHLLGDAHHLARFPPRNDVVFNVLDCGTSERLSGWRRRIFRLLCDWRPIPVGTTPGKGISRVIEAVASMDATLVIVRHRDDEGALPEAAGREASADHA